MLDNIRAFEVYRQSDVAKFILLLDKEGAEFISASIKNDGPFGSLSLFIIIYRHCEELSMETLC